jgi:hypothetical protein
LDATVSGSNEDKKRDAWKMNNFLQHYGRSFPTPFSPVAVPPLQPRPASPVRGRHFDTILVDSLPELRAMYYEARSISGQELCSGKSELALRVLEEMKTSFIAYGDVVVKGTYADDGFSIEVLPPYSRDKIRIPQKVIEDMKKSAPAENRHQRRKNAKLARRKR